MKDLLLPNTVSQKDKKPHTEGLDDTAIPHIKITITEIPLGKKVNTVNRHAPFLLSIQKHKKKYNEQAFKYNSQRVVKDQLESFSLVQSCNRTKKKLAFVSHQFIAKIVVI